MTALMMATILFAIVHMQNIAYDCGLNEIQVKCAPRLSCQPSCNEPKGKLCPRRFCDLNGCICKDGFLRDNNNNFQCINSTQCRQTSTTTPRPRCGPNEVERECALPLSCQTSCDHLNGTIHVCPLMCIRNGCECQDGFVRQSEENSTCIEESECNTIEPILCRENEEYDDCVNPCQSSCENPNQEPCETLRCSAGCKCLPGYYRVSNDTTSSCIQCPEILY